MGQTQVNADGVPYAKPGGCVAIGRNPGYQSQKISNRNAVVPGPLQTKASRIPLRTRNLDRLDHRAIHQNDGVRMVQPVN